MTASTRAIFAVQYDFYVEESDATDSRQYRYLHCNIGRHDRDHHVIWSRDAQVVSEPIGNWPHRRRMNIQSLFPRSHHEPVERKSHRYTAGWRYSRLASRIDRAGWGLRAHRGPYSRGSRRIHRQLAAAALGYSSRRRNRGQRRADTHLEPLKPHARCKRGYVI